MGSDKFKGGEFTTQGRWGIPPILYQGMSRRANVALMGCNRSCDKTAQAGLSCCRALQEKLGHQCAHAD
ncbi:hypothetical protein, partial [Pseudomonas congelans]|uniref:hypothetical protein n=1 Tax=Pseudomonas congelans TaxID=200452 RepID=UPI00196186A2